MAIKKETFVMTVIYDEENTHANSAAHAIDHSLFNEDGILEWDYQVLEEEILSSKITKESL
ncbi:hypothetical protein BH753_gp074 [Bacillus phage Shbh1]|uniref:Uncharacterized protein n=1 Tax=Bacillus phage Shbh1 TaxID=1796992 RepID=A0A142F199_9CAUD|nr:hypothetical protein BH753_gp074 [Bacillus phage Shbh1]AMQ66556.1 hypothetical protein [Bacillus phage Shbh1]